MNNLAKTYLDIGKIDQALPLLEQTLELMRATLPPDDSFIEIAMANIALAYREAGKVDQVLRHFEEMLKLRRVKLGDEHKDTLSAMNNLAIHYLDAGKLDQALSLIEETSELAKSTLGPDHEDTHQSMNILAAVYRQAGKRDRLEALYREQIAQQTGDILGAKVELGGLLLEVAKTKSADAGRSQELTREGEQWLREYLAGVRSRYANDPLELARRLYGAAEPFYRQGNFAEAEPLYREIIALRRPHSSADATDMLEPTASLARLLSDWGWAERDSRAESGTNNAEIAERAREAERLLRWVLEVRLRDSPDSWRIGDSKSRLGGALVSVAVTDPAIDAGGRRATLGEAESLLLEGHEQLQEQATDDKYKRDAVDRLVRLYEAWNKPEKRMEWQQKLALLEQAQAKLK